MSNYEANDGLSNPTGVAPPPYQQAYGPPPGYGYGGPGQQWGAWSRRRFPSETKPFFLTSEFGVSLISAILIAITAASSHAFGAWRAWILITAIVVGYNVSRGIAKAGTRSHASDPRDQVDLSRNHGHGDNH